MSGGGRFVIRPVVPCGGKRSRSSWFVTKISHVPLATVVYASAAGSGRIAHPSQHGFRNR